MRGKFNSWLLCYVLYRRFSACSCMLEYNDCSRFSAFSSTFECSVCWSVSKAVDNSITRINSEFSNFCSRIKLQKHRKHSKQSFNKHTSVVPNLSKQSNARVESKLLSEVTSFSLGEIPCERVIMLAESVEWIKISFNASELLGNSPTISTSLGCLDIIKSQTPLQ